MREFNTGDYGYGKYVSGRDATVEFLTQRQMENVDFEFGVIDEIINWLLVTERDEEFLFEMEEARKRREKTAALEGGK